MRWKVGTSELIIGVAFATSLSGAPAASAAPSGTGAFTGTGAPVNAGSSGTSGIAKVDPVSSKETGAKLALVAESCLGKKMWTGYGLSSGYLGCAAAVSNVLKISGFKYAHSAAVTQLRNQLLGSRCTREIIVRKGPKDELLDSKLVSVARPGDIVLAFMKPPESDWNGGGNAHCGILSNSSEICTNDWNDGIWKKLNIHLMFDYYPYLRIVRVEKNSR